MAPLDRQLKWLIALRLIVVTSIVVPYFLLDTFLPPTVLTPTGVVVTTAPETEAAAEDQRTGPDRPAGAEGAVRSPILDRAPTTVLITERRRSGLDSGLMYRAAGLVYLASILYLLLLRLAPGRPKLNAYVQFSGDLLMITALVYFTGGITSPFSLFYLVIIAVASTLLRREAGFTTATLAYVLYAATLLGIYFAYLPLPAAHQQGEDPIFRLTYNLVVHFVGFYAVASLTSLLARRVSYAERELEAKSESLADLRVVHRDVIQSITSGLATTDVEGRITSLNRAGEEILGSTEEEMLGRSAPQLIGEERWAKLTEQALALQPGASTMSAPAVANARVAEAQVADRAATALSTEFRSADVRSEAPFDRQGEHLHLGFTLSPLTDAAGTQHGWNMVFQDLTHWRRLEEQIRLKDRMAAVGELAAGIAHEIGNPLAAISGSAQMLSKSMAGNEQQEQLLGIVVNESQRLDRTIKSFLRFARPRERSAAAFDIARLLAENFELLTNSDEVADHHRLHLDLDPPSSEMVADPDQVSQVFWNLARNALKAMPEGGDLHVAGYGDGSTYRLSFRDTGRGMSERQRANLFHPFQSFFDSGTGIGMAIVYRIVRDHGGDTRVESAPGEGTTITVELPATAEHWTPDQVRRPAAGGLR